MDVQKDRQTQRQNDSVQQMKDWEKRQEEVRKIKIKYQLDRQMDGQMNMQS